MIGATTATAAATTKRKRMLGMSRVLLVFRQIGRGLESSL
jgi:hypothetical protein